MRWTKMDEGHRETPSRLSRSGKDGGLDWRAEKRLILDAVHRESQRVFSRTGGRCERLQIRMTPELLA